jgi:hypothetical protein
MDRNWIPIICLMIGILVGGITTFLFMINSPLSHFFYRCPDLKCENPDCICNMTCDSPDCIHYDIPCECDKPQIVKMAEDLANEAEYIGNYNCDEYAMELLRRYNNLGYDAYYCEGYLSSEYCQSDNCRHSWVKICNYIETTHGEFITPQEFQDMYILSFCRKW